MKIKYIDNTFQIVDNLGNIVIENNVACENRNDLEEEAECVLKDSRIYYYVKGNKLLHLPSSSIQIFESITENGVIFVKDCLEGDNWNNYISLRWLKSFVYANRL